MFEFLKFRCIIFPSNMEIFFLKHKLWNIKKSENFAVQNFSVSLCVLISSSRETDLLTKELLGIYIYNRTFTVIRLIFSNIFASKI